jgi:diguanylate cyclase (GGDEF)-like protein
MKILIVDDTDYDRDLIAQALKISGHTDLVFAESADKAFQILELDSSESSETEIDIILLDINMPGINGIEACSRIKSVSRFHDIPVIMVTAMIDDDTLKKAYQAGAMDYISKPFRIVELLARVESAFRLKKEIDRHKSQTSDLKAAGELLDEANRMILEVSGIDALTGIYNRHRFDINLELEWRRALREQNHLALIMIDIDYFKNYNDIYGHQAGDVCLTKTAQAIRKQISRGGDLTARYGGEEFMIILPNTNINGASQLAEKIRLAVSDLKIEHSQSKTADHVTISAGVTSTIPKPGVSESILIYESDRALYEAKNGGRNQISIFTAK